MNIKITGDGIGPPVSDDIIYQQGEITRTFVSIETNTDQGVIIVHLNRKQGDEVTLKRLAISSLRDISSGGGIMGAEISHPTGLLLFFAPQPNPSRDRITFQFFVPEELSGKSASLDLYDIAGRKILNIFKGKINQGYNRVSYKNKNLNSGVYFVVLKIEDQKRIKKFVFTR